MTAIIQGQTLWSQISISTDETSVWYQLLKIIQTQRHFNWTLAQIYIINVNEYCLKSKVCLLVSHTQVVLRLRLRLRAPPKAHFAAWIL